MRYLRRVLLVSCLSIFLLAGCASKSQDEAREESQTVIELQALQGKYAKLTADYDAASSKLKTTQTQYDELNLKYGDLSTKNNELNTKYSDLNAKYSELNAKYGEMSTKYSELSAKYDVVMQGTRGTKEGDVEQAIFKLVNENRRSAGLHALEWADGIYWWAKEHSNNMAAKKTLEYSEYSYFQDIFRAVGYCTLDSLAKAALLTWKEGSQYESKFLNKNANYGAVAATKSGEIFYIIYFAHSNK